MKARTGLPMASAPAVCPRCGLVNWPRLNGQRRVVCHACGKGLR